MKRDATPVLARDLMLLSARLQKASGGWRTLLEDGYWHLMYLCTRMLEKAGYPRRVRLSGQPVLNFGCGLHRVRGINSDLFAVHRYFKRRERPDIYLTGNCVPACLADRFDIIVCEHVLEHMLPAQALVIVRNLAQMLSADGSIQISVPSPARFVDCSRAGGSLDIVNINDIAYNYGHRFLYDEQALVALVAAAGLRDVQVNSYQSAVCKEYLLVEREFESIYVTARKP